MKILSFIFLSIIIFSANLSAQFIKFPTYTVETGTTLSGGKQTPFWLLSNQYELVTPNKSNSWLKTGFHSNIDSSRRIDYDYGFDLINRYSDKYDIYVHQAYIRIKLWFTAIQGGNIEEKFGNQDTELSSGGLLWSGNAKPMTKITFLLPNYTPIPFSRGYIEFKAGISHGWFDNNDYIKNFYLHHKYVYFQIGGKLPVHAHYGFHHFAQWGGKTSDPSIGQLPSNFSDFIKVFMGKSGEGSTPAPWEETANRIGNHIGSRNFGFDILLNKFRIDAYWQTIFEDGSGKAYRNIADGLWGLSIHSNDKSKIINSFLYEYINTTDQSGPTHDPIPGVSKGGGNDNYFNHSFYIKGWTFHDMTLGTPFITSPIIKHNPAGYNYSSYLINNKVKGYHFAFGGEMKNIWYVLMYSCIKNSGTNLYPINSIQHSFLFKTTIVRLFPFGIDANLNIGGDYSKLYGNNFGFLFSLVKTGKF